MTEQRLAGGRGSARCAPALLAVLLLGTTAACSSDSPAPEPMADETPSANASPTTAPSPGGPPTLPPEARGTSDKAAIAFVEYWVTIMNYSTAELSTRALAEISQPDCAACNAIIDSIDRIARRGGDIHGKGWILRDLEVISANARGRPQIRTQVEFTPRTVRESKDSEPLRFEGGSTVYTFDLSHSPPIGWQVSRVIGVQQ